MAERLTKHGKTTHENGICCTHFSGEECVKLQGDCSNGCLWEEKVWEKLAHYEDLEEQGRLIELPCSVGVTVHVPLGDKVQECKVVRFEIGQYVTIVLEMTMFHITFGVLDRAFGKTVFLSKDAAEAVLKGAEQ